MDGAGLGIGEDVVAHGVVVAAVLERDVAGVVMEVVAADFAVADGGEGDAVVGAAHLVAAHGDVFDGAAGVGFGDGAVFDVLPPDGRFGVAPLGVAGLLRAVEGDADRGVGVCVRAVAGFCADVVVFDGDVFGVTAAAVDGDAVAGVAGALAEVEDVVVVDAVVVQVVAEDAVHAGGGVHVEGEAADFALARAVGQFERGFVDAVLYGEGAAVAVQVGDAVFQHDLAAKLVFALRGQFDAQLQGFCGLGGGVERGGEVGAAVVEGDGRDVVFAGECPAGGHVVAVAGAVFL